MSGIDAAPALPTDVASLQAMVLAHEAELMEIRAQRQAQEAELAAARAGLIEQRFEIEALKSRLAKLQRMTFGRSSEKPRDQVEQLELALADIDEMLGEITPADASADVSDEHRCASQLAVRFLRLYRVRWLNMPRPVPAQLRRCAAPVRRACHRDPGLCARLVPGDPACPKLLCPLGHGSVPE